LKGATQRHHRRLASTADDQFGRGYTKNAMGTKVQRDPIHKNFMIPPGCFACAIFGGMGLGERNG
jgi:hypothetical protein